MPQSPAYVPTLGQSLNVICNKMPTFRSFQDPPQDAQLHVDRSIGGPMPFSMADVVSDIISGNARCRCGHKKVPQWFQPFILCSDASRRQMGQPVCTIPVSSLRKG